MIHLRLLAVLTTLGAMPAQNQLGILRNTDAGDPVRGGGAADTNWSVQWNRIDVERYAGWGHVGATVAVCAISGLHLFLQDQNGATTDPFSLVVYTADPVLTDFPLVAAPVMTGSSFVAPATGPGPVAWEVSLNFATPAQAPSNVDVYVGVFQQNVWNSTLTDGMSTWSISGANSAFGSCDLPGPAAPAASPGNTYGGCFVPSTGLLAYLPKRQFYIEPIVATAGGVASALHHNDPHHGAANFAPGTSCMFSSQFPDSRVVPLNAGRADDLGMTFQMAGITNGSPVFWLAELSSTFSPPVSLWFIPGSTGAVCANPQNVVTLGFSTTALGRATHVMVFTPAMRALLPGLSILQQAVAFDTGTSLLHAGPAQISSF